MSKQLKLNPRVAYVLGIYAYNKGTKATIGVVTKSNEIVQRFVKVALDDFKILPNKILIEAKEDEIQAYFYNSKLKKLFDKALERKERLFKYMNDYSAAYFAGIFEMKGGSDSNGLYIRHLDKGDAMLLEKIGIHTEAKGSKTYIKNARTFMTFIRTVSAKIF
ncbi:MAG: hypothetical protein LVQ95_04595 [Candidatus Micrarchaeales archaeon]|nr:hypothetical protein [Candidatus Micrarchaeales archaeon]